MNYFWKKKATENPRVYVCIHVYAYTHSSYAYACLLHAHTYTGMCKYARVLETM